MIYIPRKICYNTRMKTALLTPAEYNYVQHENIILFQSGPLSQWYGGFHYQHSVFFPVIDGKSTPFSCNCAEQWMMLAKAALFDDKETFDLILAEKHPKEQKELGRKIKNFDSKLWDEHKYNVVLNGNTWKFEQNYHLKTFLQQFPKDTVFAEAAPWDPVWGIGLAANDPDALDISKWRGENLLGKVITQVRNSI